MIIDDDVSFTLELNMLFDKYDFCSVEVANTYNDGISMLRKIKWDLALIDISIEHADTGFILSKYAHENNIPFIVMTSYKEQAKLDMVKDCVPLAFFTKPIDRLSLDYVLFSKLIKPQEKETLPASAFPNKLFIKNKSIIDVVDFQDIEVLEVEGNYVIVHSTQKKIVYRSSLKTLIANLQGNVFIRIHRNFLVNKFFIKNYDIENKLLTLINDKQYKVSRNYRRNLKGIF